MSLSFRRISLLAALLLLAALAPGARVALANSITVTSFADDTSPGTLRRAILDANASSGPDTITFSGPGTINLSSPLPALTGGDITIDGTFPPNGTVPKVEIRGGGQIEGAGILIHSSRNTIRGLILNGFISDVVLIDPDKGGAGVTISGVETNGAAHDNVIEYNYIGTNAAGNGIGANQSGNNTTAGVLLTFGASANTIQNNVISGNLGVGVYLSVTGRASDTFVKDANIIRDNLIGLTADGTAALPNITHGVWVGNNAQNTVIGPGNVISGNGAGAPIPAAGVYGVLVKYEISVNPPQGVFFPRGTLIKGNKIGANPAGAAAIPNRDGGVVVSVSTNTTVGGASAADPNERNLISGNNTFGVALEDYALDNTRRTLGAVVKNNWIGLDASGAAPLPNRSSDLLHKGTGVLLHDNVGGAKIGPGNVISGNSTDAGFGGFGVQVQVTSEESGRQHQAGGNEISGNLIGTTADGLSVVPNQNYGVALLGDTSGNQIKDNRITGNQVAGVDLEPNGSSPAPHNNTISGNQIGTLAGGSTQPGNGTFGVKIAGGSANNTIGAGNLIAGHIAQGGAGVLIDGAGSNGNSVLGNNVVNNAIGIRVTGGAVGNRISQTTTSANAGKGIQLDSGGNGMIDPARLTVTAPTDGATVTGSVTGCAAGCTVEVFSGDSPLDNEGPAYVAAVDTTGAFSVPCRPYMIFTLTEKATSNTSEFIHPIALSPQQCAPAAPVLSLSDASPAPSQSGAPGAIRTFTHQIKNEGNTAGALTVTYSSSNSWSTTLDTSNCPATLAPGQSCAITLTVTIPTSAQTGERNDTTITATLAGAPAQQKTDTTTVLFQAGLDFTAASPQSAGPGQPVSFQHTLTNLGTGDDTFEITATTDWSYSIAPTNPIALAKGAAVSVTVTLTPPANIASGVYTATVRARSVSAPGVYKDVTDVVKIIGAAVPQITSTVTPPSADPRAEVTISYTIANVGNQAGTFNLAFTPQSGWTVTHAISPSVTLAPNATATVSATLQAPTLAGAYAVTLRATAADNNAASATKTDLIEVNKRAALAWSPDLNTPDRAPNAVYTDTLTLTNNGNFTDTVSLEASSTRGWGVRPLSPTLTLNPGASAPVKVELSIPPGQIAGISNTTTVTATSSLAPPSVQATARITTTVAAVPGVMITPPFPLPALIAGKPVTLTFTLMNSGSISQSYTLTDTVAPRGWAGSFAPLTTPLLAPGATAPVTVTLTAPAGTPDGTTATVTVTAKCGAGKCADSETVSLTVGPIFNIELGGSCDNSARPGALITCVHTVTNTGLTTDTYLLSAVSPLGWPGQVAPSTVTVKPGATRPFTVTLLVPATAEAGLTHALTVRARSAARPDVSKTITDTTKVSQVAGVGFSPSRVAPLQRGTEIQFQHIVLNTGNGPDRFTISVTQELTWTITVVPTTTPLLQRGTFATVLVKVLVPRDVPFTAINRIRLRATSEHSPTVSSELIDVVGIQGAPSNYVYLPVAAR